MTLLAIIAKYNLPIRNNDLGGIKHYWGVCEQNSTDVDNWTAELAITASNVFFLKQQIYTGIENWRVSFCVKKICILWKLYYSPLPTKFPF